MQVSWHFKQVPNSESRKPTSAKADVITLGMGSVMSPILRLITLASGYLTIYAALLLAI